MRWGFEALIWNEFGDGECTFYQKVDLKKAKAEEIDWVAIRPCMPNQLGFKYSYWTSIIVMAGMVVVLRIGSAIGFKLILGKFRQ